MTLEVCPYVGVAAPGSLIPEEPAWRSPNVTLLSAAFWRRRSPPMPGLPTGTVTFLFTDIEGSTTLLQWPAIAGYGAVGGVAPGSPHEEEQ